MKNNTINTRMLAMSAMLSAVSFVLAFFEFPVPLSPAFARMDLSDFPALIGAFAFGPVSGLLIELVKNALQLLTTSTGGVGELANFIMGGSFAVTAGLIYNCHKTKKTAVIASFGEFIPFIKTKLDVVLYNAFPFNLLKGLVIGGFTMLLYKHLSPILKGVKGDHAR